MKTIRFFALAALLVFGVSQARATGREIYPDPSQARAELAAALETAAQTHKRILLDFGGNWCPDCQVLNIYFHDAVNRISWLVDVNIGRMDANLEIAREYGVPLGKGVPALAVLSDRGKLLFSQQGGEFENMRSMDSPDVTRFLLQWKPARR